MLALSRKKNEALIITKNTSPKELPIYRKEVYVQIQEANKEAVNTDGIEALKGLLGGE